MAEHHELVAEMHILEKMDTQERQKLAKKRRLQQLKKYFQLENESIAREKQLNKRLASRLGEENNQINLKNYKNLGSNQRVKKKSPNHPQLLSPSLFDLGGNEINGNNSISNDSNNNNSSNRFQLQHTLINGNQNITKNLATNGRVHFDAGVMLLEAAARNDYDEVKRLLNLGVSPNSTNHDGLTALHQCCIDASESIMNLLLEFGAYVDSRDTEQWTPLHAACTCGHLNLVKILVDNGANLLAVNGDGNMPFDVCEEENTLEFIESQMVQQGITQEKIDSARASNEMRMMTDLEKLVSDGLNDINQVVFDNDVTPLHIAAANGYTSVVKFLLEQNANANVCDNDQWRPLHGAACWGNEGHIRIVELLVEHGAQLNAKTLNDETAFDLCDNPRLLERLNQLKDEYESRQASERNQLKRTQSRTNSRVHSIRRTSVRDKSLISRRDAREEALLRADSSSNIPNVPQSNESDSRPPPDDEISERISHVSLDHSDRPKIDTSTLAKIADSDSATSENRVEQTDLDRHLIWDGKNSDYNLTKDNSVFTEDKRSQNPATSSPNLSSRVHKASKESDTKICRKDDVDCCDSVSNLPGKCQNRSQIVKESVPNITSHGPQEIANGSNITRNPSLVDDVPRQPNVSAVQFTPFNYTLANLKKQRSDLRMRTTSIGGANSNGPYTISTSTNGIPDGVHQLPRDQQGVSVDSIDSNQYPNMAVRKFSGEPSDAMGISYKPSRHKCCILI